MFTNFRSKALLAFAPIALAQCLSAADGITLIEPKSLAGGRVSPGFPVTISQPGSYRLTGNLEVADAASTAIHITADNVTLDLNGFTISGPNVCTGSPVRCTFSGTGVGILAVAPVGVVSPANIKIMNGVVKGMGGHGIRMLGDATMVQNVTAVSNGGPGIVVGEGSVIDSFVKLNGSGSAIVGLIVRGCTANNNVFGITVRPGGIATGNVANGNSATGLSMTNGTATGNVTNNNVTYGIDATCPGVVTGNTAQVTCAGVVQAVRDAASSTLGMATTKIDVTVATQNAAGTLNATSPCGNAANPTSTKIICEDSLKSGGSDSIVVTAKYQSKYPLPWPWVPSSSGVLGTGPMLSAKAAVLSQFGPDSDEVEAMGLKRKSEYRRPERRRTTD